MPKMEGTEILCEIRKIEQQRNIPSEKRSRVIMVTAMADRDTVIACLHAGCDGYVIKPFNRTIMAQKLWELGMITPRLFRNAKNIVK
jgi:two-component system chemotaxis response regulator CheY